MNFSTGFLPTAGCSTIWPFSTVRYALPFMDLVAEQLRLRHGGIGTVIEEVDRRQAEDRTRSDNPQSTSAASTAGGA